MYLTAHGGALNTGRNTPEFFETIKNYPVDIIEVDVQSSGGLLYISHVNSLTPKKEIPLSFVFEFIDKYDFKVNCDVKKKGMVKPVLELAVEMGVENRIFFTGKVRGNDLKNLTAGRVYLNLDFFRSRLPVLKYLWLYFYRNALSSNKFVEKLCKIIAAEKHPAIAGINLKYKYCTEKMLEIAQRNNLRLSVYTVDDVKVLKRLLRHQEIDNITTNIPDKALEIIRFGL